MKKNKVFYHFIFLLLIFIFVISPTFGKYTYNTVGTASNLVFVPVKFMTDTFVVYDDNFKDENGNSKNEAKDNPKWGTESGDKDYNLHSLTNVGFTASNKSSQDLLVCFDIKFEMNNISGWNSQFNVTLKNIETGEALTGAVTFTRGRQISGGIFGLGATYEYTGIVNPMNLGATDVNTNIAIVEKSFVLYSNQEKGYTSGSYQLSIDFESNGLEWIGEIIGNSEYIAVSMLVSPYPPVSS